MLVLSWLERVASGTFLSVDLGSKFDVNGLGRRVMMIQKHVAIDTSYLLVTWNTWHFIVYLGLLANGPVECLMTKIALRLFLFT